MDKKKLIGTIIGVTLFAMLIAGATFAWLTFSVGVTNGTYTAGTMEFKIDYIGGGTIEQVPILSEATSDTAAAKEIKAYRTSNSPDGTLTISLTATTDNVLTDNDIIHYAVCSADGTTHCTKLASGEPGVLSTGTIRSGTQELYKTTDTEDPDDDEIAINLFGDMDELLSVNYVVYLWLDSDAMDTTMVGETFSGYIHASAEQDGK